MKPIEIVELIKQQNPDALGNIPDKKAAAVIRKAFQELARTVRETEEGEVRLPGFGVFRIRQVEREKDGEKEMVKRVVFRPASEKKPTPEEESTD